MCIVIEEWHSHDLSFLEDRWENCNMMTRAARCLPSKAAIGHTNYARLSYTEEGFSESFSVIHRAKGLY